MPIKLTNLEGSAILEWQEETFYEVCQLFNPQHAIKANVSEYFSFELSEPFKCTILIWKDGRLIIKNMATESEVQQVFEEIILKIMEEKPELTIIIREELQISYDALVALKHDVDISRLKKSMKKEFMMMFSGNFVYLPFEVHRIEGVTILMSKDFVNISSAQKIKNLEWFLVYLNFVLRGFSSGSSEMKKLEEAWNDFNRDLGENSRANRIDQSNSKNEWVKMDDD